MSDKTRCLDKAPALGVVDDTRDVPRAVFAAALATLEQYMAAHDRCYPPTPPDAGADSARAGVGLPGHCSVCAIVGHVVAHPERGCGDVRCDYSHPETVEAPAAGPLRRRSCCSTTFATDHAFICDNYGRDEVQS